MSLVVARRIRNAIAIVSDTHLTERQAGRPVHILRGVIKAISLGPYLTICFAGDVRVAGHTILRCAQEWLSLTPDDLIKEFSKVHLGLLHAENAADFILAFANPSNPSRLVSIKGGQSVDCDTAWIGDAAAFEEFQRQFHAPEPGNILDAGSASLDFPADSDHPDMPPELLRKMRFAMQSIINDPRIRSVGGFVVPLMTTSKDLRYLEYFYSQTASMDLEVLEGLTEIPIGSAEDGHYSMYFTFGDDGYSCYPLMYFVQGRFGISFRVTKNGTLRARKYSEPSFEQFIAKARESGLTVNTTLPTDPTHISTLCGWLQPGWSQGNS